MSFPLSYCGGGYETLERLRRLYVDRRQDLVLARMDVPTRARDRFRETHPPGYCEYPDPAERARFWDAYLCERAGVRDDSVPAAYLSEMDQGLYGALVGGSARFLCDPDSGWISSMVKPILSDLAELDRLSFSAEGEWFRRYVRQMRAFAEAGRGKFGVSHLILINGLNFVFELVGATQTYLALVERPDAVLKAIDLAFELNVLVQRAFFDAIPLLEGGTCSNMAQWLPGRIISESVDPFHMTSVDYFERWGRGQLERIFSRFDGGVVHIHGNGRHLLEAVSTVRGLKAIYVADDRGYPRAFEVLGELKARAGALPLIVDAGYEEFALALKHHRLAAGVFYSVNGVPDVDAANRCMEAVREYEA